MRDKWLFLTNYESYLQLQTHREKLVSKQEIREDARIVSEFIDLHRAIGKEWSSIYKAVKAKEITQGDIRANENYKKLIADTHYKNSFAVKILKNIDQHQKALERLGIKKETVVKAAMDYENKDAKKQTSKTIEQNETEKSVPKVDKKTISIDNIQAVMDRYKNLLKERNTSIDKKQIKQIEEKMNYAAVKIFTDKRFLSVVTFIDPKLSKIIESRAKLAISKSKDQDQGIER